jgi:DNA-binding LytR/AlgR family response regulator
MIRAVLIDDEAPALERLRSLLKGFPDIDIVGEAQDGIAALSVVEIKKPDVIFLDIDMPELSGLEVAKTLGIAGPMIIFVTAYDEYALQAFESNAIDYLVKPINRVRLDLTIEKLRSSLAKTADSRLSPRNFDGLLSQIQQKREAPSRLAVKIGSRYEVFDPTLISAILSKDNYTSLILNDRELLSDDSLESMLTRLDSKTFLRVHRGAIVNVKFLKELKREGDRKYIAVLSDTQKTQLAVSRERLPSVKAFLGLE